MAVRVIQNNGGSSKLSAGHRLAQAEAGPVNSTKLVHVNAISNIYKINIRGSISPRAGIYLAYINGQDQLGRFYIILQYLVDSTRLWPKMFQL